jgi:hypothetical protein
VQLVPAGVYVVMHNQIFPIRRVRKDQALGRIVWTEEKYVSNRETRGGERPVQQGTPSQRTFRTTSCGRSGLYLQFRSSAMADKYRIAHDGSDFIVNHMLTTARSLVNAAVEAHRRLHNTDRQAAHSSISEAAG